MAATAEDIELPEELEKLAILVNEKPESFATGSSEIQDAALTATKFVYDLALKTEAQARGPINDFLASISPSFAPQTRSQTAKGNKRKRDPPAYKGPTLQKTPLTELYTDGMNEDQLWAQLELRAKNVCGILRHALDDIGESLDDSENEEEDLGKRKRKVVVDGEEVDLQGLEGLEMDSDGENGESEEEDEDEDEDEDEEDEDMEEEEEEEGREEDLGEGVEELRDPSEEEDDEEDETVDLDKPSIPSSSRRKAKGKARGGHPELDDGFFDLAAFNAETEAVEARAVSRGRLGGDGSDEDDENEELVDMFAPVDGDDAALGEDDGEQEFFYKDFFDPPARSATAKGKGKARINEAAAAPTGKVRFHEEVRVKKIKPKGKNLPTSMIKALDVDDDDDDDEEDGEKEVDDEEDDEGSEGIERLSSESAKDSDEEAEYGSSDDVDVSEEISDEEDGLETMERFKDDLFADEEEERPDVSTHEKRMAALQEEIAALEADNVAKKNWTLMGEATSRSRPQNSLLEEDLEYERIMKTVPVITEETVQSLEERIKARILEGEYDDVIRKRPVDDKPFLPSRFFELNDTKSKQSLAEIYEDEFVAAQTGGVAGEDRDGKLRKEHEEIEKLWESICGKLDALCNAHFTPKAPKATISTVSNVAAASMESALPTTMSTSSMLAPEEVFAPPSQVDLRARSELTPAEKRALHNKQKKAKKKARDVLEKSVDKFAKSKRIGDVKKQKEAALKSIVKSGKGVTVVGKKSKDVAEKRTRTKTT
ncbi:Mpp10 protein [Wolfiporia cocos MD-104 SS10]|uniref:U3 small nucleolar ribonucleoprotein protein MPP10 n=1 Tax=Wolfiporia cocos (strain MD-104) TaxID=742152 RepID=A0A2H3IUF1_WOLCO|nr:Mpp10 protein [Wolfiporia cocos MD-104 SS10]